MYKVLNNKNKLICALVIKVSLRTADDVQCVNVQAPPSEAHTHSPRVVCEHFVLLLDDAGVHALVDGVGHDGNVVAF